MKEFWIDIPAEKTDMPKLRTLKADGLPVVVPGAGEVAIKIRDRLHAAGVADVRFAVSEGFHKPEGVYSCEEIDATLPAYNLVPGFRDAIIDETGKFAAMYETFRHKKRIVILTNFYEWHVVTEITAEYFREHFDSYKRLYDLLADDKSRESYKAFLSAKLSEDYSNMASLVETPQYFSGDFLHFEPDEVFVDCGAYDGDTIRDFEKYAVCTTGGGGKIYAFEPDPNNTAKLEAYVKSSGLKDVEIIPCATYERATTLKFQAFGNMCSNAAESGTVIVPTETIDNVTQGKKVTFIKMDIEGSERNALKGAEQTIRKYHPKLAICAYHKMDDCIVLPEIIRNFWDGYKFYFRLHKPNIHDAVLYAVPPQN